MKTPVVAKGASALLFFALFAPELKAEDVFGTFYAHVIYMDGPDPSGSPNSNFTFSRILTSASGSVSVPHGYTIPAGYTDADLTFQTIVAQVSAPGTIPKAAVVGGALESPTSRLDFVTYGGSVPVSTRATGMFTVGNATGPRSPCAGGILSAGGSQSKLAGQPVGQNISMSASNNCVSIPPNSSGSVFVDGNATTEIAQFARAFHQVDAGFPATVRAVFLSQLFLGGQSGTVRVDIRTYYDFSSEPKFPKLDVEGLSPGECTPNPFAGQTQPDAPAACSAPSIRFGTMAVGESRYRPIFIRNKGAAPLNVQAVELLNVPAGLTRDFLTATDPFATLPQTVAPGERLRINVRWFASSPDDLEARDAKVRITTDDPERPVVVHPLRGQAINIPAYGSAPSPGEDISFGDVALGQTKTTKITIFNRGSVTYNVESMELIDAPPGMEADLRFVNFPRSIPPAFDLFSRLEVELNWTPQSIMTLRTPGTYAPVLHVRTSDPANPLIIYFIRGSSAHFTTESVEEIILGWLFGSSAAAKGGVEPNAPTVAPGCVTAPPDMVAWHPGEGGANDIVGNNDGTLQNGAAFTSGKVGQAFSFDGVNDYIDLGDRLDRVATNFTIEVWVKGDPSMNAWGRVLDKGFQSGFTLSRVASTNKVGFEFLASGSQGNGFATVKDVIDNTWHHVAVVKSGNTATIYADGVAENSETVSTAAQDNTLPLLIGFNPGQGIQGYWKGQIDEPTIYNRALSAQEIQAIFNAGSAGKCRTASPTTETATLKIDPAVSKNLTAQVPAFLGGGSVQFTDFTGQITVSLISIPGDPGHKRIRIEGGLLTAPSVQLPGGLSTGPNTLTFGAPEDSGGTLDVATGNYTANAGATIYNQLIPFGVPVRGSYSGVYNAQSGKISVQSQSKDLFKEKDQPLNIATRMRVQSGDNVLIGGFIILGNDPKRVIIRGIGPSLSGISNALADPTVVLRQGAAVIAQNDNWREQEAAVLATTIPPTHNNESAIVITLAPGAYTAVLAGKNNGTGVGVVEVYDLDRAADSRLANISSRGFVETGNNVMIGGMIIGSPVVVNGAGVPQGGARTLVRAIGPSLADAGVANALPDPVLELRDGNGALVAQNDNWRSDQEAEIIATTIPPSRNEEAAIVRTLAAGAYTAIVRGAGNSTGVGLVEVYNLQ